MQYFNFCLFSILFFHHSFCIAQDPSYFVLGEKEFKNAEIYSIIYTKKQAMYVATNEGLYLYRYGEMKPILNAPEQKGSSLFNLVENSENEVFCFNLNGQIFKVVNNHLELFYQIPQRYNSEMIQMAYTITDELIICANGCISLKKKNIKEIVYPDHHKQKFSLSQLPDQTIVIHIPGKDSIIKINKDGVRTVHDDHFYNSKSQAHYLYHLKDSIFSDNTIANSKSNRHSVKNQKLYTYYQPFDNEIWRRGIKGGVELIKYDDKNKVVKSHFFQNKFISAIAYGKNGIVFLGTFGEGLFVIPNLNVKNYSSVLPIESPQAIVSDQENNVFISDRINGIFHFKDSVSKIETALTHFPNRIFMLQKNTAHISRRFPHLLFASQQTYGALKKIFEIDSSTYLLASSLGLTKHGKTIVIADSLWKKPTKKTPTDKLSTVFNSRCHDAVYDQKRQVLYVATISSLQFLDKSAIVKELKYKGNSIIANDILWFDDKLWCGTQGNGILVFKNNKLVQTIDDKTNLESNYIYSFENTGDKLYISHKTGFQIYDISANTWQTIGYAEGIENGSIKDFSLSKDHIWFLSNNQIIAAPIDGIENKSPQITIEIDSIVVGNQTADIKHIEAFNYFNNSLSVYLNYNNLLYEKESKINCQLTGEQNLTRSFPATQQKIDFPFLPPGNYQLKIQAMFRDISTEPIIYTFNIKKPYWQTWWFILALVVLLISIIWFIIIVRTKKIARTNNEKLEKKTLETEIIASQLKALRSQMNPHFIFNALNSIQDLILQKDTNASYDYIVLFSGLVRNVLTYSNQSSISIGEEVEFLESYLTLEKLRFGHDFNFIISQNDLKSIKIPALITQPFVENAVVHGLFHKKGQKLLSITFYKMKSSTIKCVIEDNGIGQTHANQIKARQKGDHNSYGLIAIKKRLDILSLQYGNQFTYTLKNKIVNEFSSGTIVEIYIPVMK